MEAASIFLKSKRAIAQQEVTSFAMFIFSWYLAYAHERDTLAFPLNEDAEDLARYAIRHFLATAPSGAEDFAPVMSITARALHMRFHLHAPDALIDALDDIRSLIAEEAGLVPRGMQLQG